TSQTSGIYTLSLHDALPISVLGPMGDARLLQIGVWSDSAWVVVWNGVKGELAYAATRDGGASWEKGGQAFGEPCSRVPMTARVRSEEHTSELQSRGHLVCRL